MSRWTITADPDRSLRIAFADGPLSPTDVDTAVAELVSECERKGIALPCEFWIGHCGVSKKMMLNRRAANGQGAV